MGARFRLKAKRERLRATREHAGSQAGLAFSGIQQYLSDRDIKLPDNIAATFFTASTLRDQLGISEAEYDVDEAEHNLLEWSYTKKETKFITALLGPQEDSPSISAGLQSPHSNPQDSMQRPYGTADTWGLADLTHQAGSVGTYVYDDQLHAEPEGYYLDIPEFRNDVVDVEPSALSRPLSSEDDTTYLKPQIIIEEKVNRTSSLRSTVRIRVESWLQETMTCSTLQKLRLRSFAPPVDVDEQTWLAMAIKHWSFISRSPSRISDTDVVSCADATETQSMTSEMESITKDHNETEHHVWNVGVDRFVRSPDAGQGQSDVSSLSIHHLHELLAGIGQQRSFDLQQKSKDVHTLHTDPKDESSYGQMFDAHMASTL